MTKRQPSRPRGRRTKSDAERKALRATRLTSTRGVANPGKLDEVMRVFDRVCGLKNRMSAYCHENLTALFVDAYAFQSHYKTFASRDLNAWERQTLFQDVVKFYQTSLKRRFKNLDLGIQQRMVIERYQRATRTAKKGDVKLFRIEKKATRLTAALKYLLHVEDLARFDPLRVENEAVRENLVRLKDGPLWARLVALAAAKRNRLIGTVRQIQFSTGSHRRHPKESDSRVVCDAGNGKYRYFYRFRIGAGRARRYVHLPLLFNARRCTPEQVRAEAAHVCYARRGKFMAGMTYEAPEPVFRPEDRWLGLDANTKHNLFAASDGRVWSYEQLEIDALIALLTKLTQDGTQAMSYRQRGRWAKLCRQNEARIQRLIAGMLDAFEAEGVTDLCLEDLDIKNDATFLAHHGLNVKYSRLLRLLRLSNLKHWMARQAEKRGIRVHLTHPGYTSQECPQCHHVERANRPTQEQFGCTSCGFAAPADHVAGHNTKERVRGVLGSTLHTYDPYGRATPKPMRRDVLKSLVMNQPVSNGECLGDFTELSSPRTTAPPSRKNKQGREHPSL